MNILRKKCDKLECETPVFYLDGMFLVQKYCNFHMREFILVYFKKHKNILDREKLEIKKRIIW